MGPYRHAVICVINSQFQTAVDDLSDQQRVRLIADLEDIVLIYQPKSSKS